MITNRISSDHTEKIQKDFVVIGGGLAGVCAAVSAARSGLRVALCEGRSVLGGNSSSEYRVWICGATGMGTNRYADETGIVGELSNKNLYRNPEGNPYLWDALLLETVWLEKNIELFLNTHLVNATVEDGAVASVGCMQLSTEKYIEFTAPMFADCTGDGLLARLATGEAATGNRDVDENARNAYNLDDTFSTLGNTILFYVKKEMQPVRYIAPAFALSRAEIERVLKSTGKLVSPDDSGCDYWWLEYGGTMDTIENSESIRRTLSSLVYGVWDYIKNSGKFDSDCLTLEWVGSIPGRRESKRAIAQYTLTHDDILSGKQFSDAVCHGGWPIDTHPSSGFFDARKSCRQLPVNPYDIPLSCLITKNAPNVLLAGRAAGMTHLAMASARVMKTCGVEGQAIGTAAAFAWKNGKRPDMLLPNELEALQQTILRDDVWIPGRNLSCASELTQGMLVSASAPLVPETKEPNAYLPLDTDAFILLTPMKKESAVTVYLSADNCTDITLTLYESASPLSFKPEKQVGSFFQTLERGINKVRITCPIDFECNYVLCIPTANGVSIGKTDEPLPGVLGVFSENALGINWFAPAIRIDGMTNLYTANHINNGFTRPFAGMHLWASSLEDAFIELTTDTPREIGEIDVYLENALFRPYNNLRPLKDSLTGTHMHPGLLKHFILEAEGPQGVERFNVEDNCLRHIRFSFTKKPISHIRLTPIATWGASYAAIHEIAAFA